MTRVRNAAGALILLAALAGAGCSDDVAAPEAGRIAGSLTVLGEILPEPGNTGQVYLLRGPDDSRTDALRTGPLQGGPRDFTFDLQDVPGGTYYLQACVVFGAGSGCTHYTLDPTGNPSAFEVSPGSTVTLEIAF